MTGMPTTPMRPLTKAIIAMLCPGLAIALFYAGIWTDFTNSRVLDGLLVLPLAVGAYCGIVAFRARNARVGIRVLGLLAAVVCLPYAAVMLFITVFGLR